MWVKSSFVTYPFWLSILFNIYFSNNKLYYFSENTVINLFLDYLNLS